MNPHREDRSRAEEHQDQRPGPENGHSHVLTLSWKISGGTAPYRLEIKLTGPDGQTVVESEEMLEGDRRFELAYPKGGNVIVSVEVEDAAGASGTASVNLAP